MSWVDIDEVIAIMSEFTVVVCHGSYHSPIPYKPFITALQKQGIESYYPQLPTSDLQKLNVGTSPDELPDFSSPPPANGYPQPANDAVLINDKLLRKKARKLSSLATPPADL